MNTIQTSQQLIEQLENLQFQEHGKEEAKNLIKLLKLALQRDQTNFDSLTRNMDEGVAHCEIICDKEGVPYDYRFLSVNDAFEAQSGLQASTIVGRTILDIFPKSEKFWIDFYGKVALTQQPNSVTKYSPNLQKHIVASAYSIVKGKFTMLFKDVTDSMELAAAHLQIAKSQERNSAILENMQDGFAHCETICNENGIPIDYRFLYANKAFQTQTGVKPEDTMGKTVLELFPDIEKSWIEIYGKVALTEESHSFINFNHNTSRYYQVNAFSPAKGEFVSFVRDITDQETKRIQLEDMYLKAEENDKLKSAFLANMSHEVRTPMNAILGFASLLEDDTISETDKKTCLKQIKSSGNQLLTIISDIVDISKIDAHQQTLVFEECDLNMLVDSLHNRFLVLNTNTDISLRVEKGSESEAFMIITDPTRLNQILSNLIENALKYTNEGEVVFGYSIEGKHLQFFIKDTGIGIQKEDQKLVFERFGQIKNKSRTSDSGTGLGIPIAKGLIDLFKGDIWIESEPQKGSTFYFNISYNPPIRTLSEKNHKHTILIAEDDDVNFLLLDLWLKAHFNVIRAVNGFEAVHIFEKNHSIDLIIMDIKMPYMDGIEATKQIRKTDMYIPIIAHTAYAMNEESIAIKKAGCDQVLIKPIERETLLDVLAAYQVSI